jgi:exoribonuclease R
MIHQPATNRIVEEWRVIRRNTDAKRRSPSASIDEQMEKLITQTNAREKRAEKTRRSCYREIIATFDYSRLSSLFSKLGAISDGRPYRDS